MNIAAEKSAIIQQLQTLNDEAVIRSIRQLLDAASGNTLEHSIQRGIADADAGRVTPHATVMAELRTRYGA